MMRAKKPRAKAKRARTLPLDDARWWTWKHAIEHVHQVRVHLAIALHELATAINRRDVHCKMDALNPGPPPRRVVVPLEDKFFEAFHVEPSRGGLVPVSYRPDVQLFREHALFAWGPDVERLWPTASRANPSEPRADDKPRRKRPRAYQLIRDIADELWPDGYEHIDNPEIIKRVGDEYNKRNLRPPNRDRVLRALGRRKG
jgi:hypothetical protein